MIFEIFKASTGNTLADRLTALVGSGKVINFIVKMHQKPEYLIAYT